MVHMYGMFVGVPHTWRLQIKLVSGDAVYMPDIPHHHHSHRLPL